MVGAEISLSPTPHSSRQRFPHFIPRGDGLVASALPELKEVPWSSGTRGMSKDIRIWTTVLSFSVQNDVRDTVSRASQLILHINAHQIRPMERWGLT